MPRQLIRSIIALSLLAVLVLALRPPLRNARHNAQAPSRLYVHTQGNGKPIVLLHGLTGTHEYFAPLSARLAQNNRVIAPDLLGFGQSPWPDISYSVHEHLEALAKVLPNERFALIGHSMGALLALEYARRHPGRVTRLVLISPPSIRDRDALGEILKAESDVESLMQLDRFWAPIVCHIHEVFGKLSFYLYRPFVKPALPDAVVLAATQHRWASYNGSLENVVLKIRATEWLPDVRVPMLVIIGDHDAYVDQTNLLAVVPNPVIAHGGHNVLWEQPEVVMAQIERFANTNANAH
jgi:pimeloyl-ACP methyl ester carboxylesterase